MATMRGLKGSCVAQEHGLQNANDGKKKLVCLTHASKIFHVRGGSDAVAGQLQRIDAGKQKRLLCSWTSKKTAATRAP